MKIRNFLNSSSTFVLVLLSCFTAVINVNAQALDKTAVLTQVNLNSGLIKQNIALTGDEVKCVGSFAIKDGLLDHISSMKMVLANSALNTLFETSDHITFEQTHMMVLPMMGMVHVVGMLKVGGEENRADFQLHYKVNKDNSITLNGTKAFKLSDYTSKAIQREVQLDINFKIKNEEQLSAK